MKLIKKIKVEFDRGRAVLGHYVYKYVLNKEIIYIGKTDCDLEQRLLQHGKSGDNIPEEGWVEINNSDIYYAELANSTMSDVVESELIRKYKPKYNIAKMSDWSGLNFIEPVWYLYKNRDAELQHLKSEIQKYKNENNALKEELKRAKEI